MTEIEDLVYRVTDGTVQRGPFKWMKLLRDQPCPDGNFATKLMGVYEWYLQRWLEQVIKAQPTHVVNVGCAEGYYAVGMALKLPAATVTAVDINPECLRVTRANAALNNVDIQVTDTLPLLFPGTFIMMDCEGAEEQYLSNPQFNHCDVLVECHEFMHKGITQRVREILEKQHTVHQIDNPLHYPTWGHHQGLTNQQYHAAVLEKRPSPTSFIYATVK